MRVIALCLAPLILVSSSAYAADGLDVHGLVFGNEGARYVRGVPTLDLQQRRGVIHIRSLGFYNKRPVFAIAFFNAGQEPVNIGLEDIRVSASGEPLRVFSVQELERQAKKKNWWSSFGLAMMGAASSAAAASQRNTYRSTMTSRYGSYSYSASYPSLAGQLRANAIQADTTAGLMAIRHQLDQTLDSINEHVVQRTTVDPGGRYGGLIVLDKLKNGRPPLEIRLSVDWNGERYPFGFLVQKAGKPVPERYQSMLASKAKPTKLKGATFAAGTAGASTADNTSAEKSKGALWLRSGAVKVPAKTPSGYCLETPPDYVATGTKDFPIINTTLPRCSTSE